MYDKEQILAKLRDVFNRWDELLATMSEKQITDANLPSDWSIKDVVAHLWGWQQRSVARNEAALHGSEPEYPRWLGPSDSDPEENLDQTNDWIYETNRDKPWPNVYADWKAQFLHLIESSERIPEEDMLDPNRYAWMDGYPLGASLVGSCEHHEEHLEQLLV